MRKVITLAAKDLLLLWRDKFGLFWVAVFPLLFAVFFGSIFSMGSKGPSAISIALVDQDSTQESQAFVEKLSTMKELDAKIVGFEDAKNMVRKGRVAAYVVVEEGYSANSDFIFAGEVPIKIGSDPSRKAESAYLQGILMKTMYEGFQERMSNPVKMTEKLDEMTESMKSAVDLTDGQRKTLVDLFSGLRDFVVAADAESLDMADAGMGEIKVETVERETTSARPRSYYDISFPQSVLWGLIGCAASFALSIVYERSRGTLIRLRLAPISRVHILAGKGLACFISCVGVIILLMLFGGLIFGVNISNTLNLALAAAASAFCFVGIMMLLSILGKTERSVAGAGWSVLMIIAMLGGGMVPAMVMPSWMKTLSHLSPAKWAVYSLEGAIWRGYTLSEMMQPIGILVGIGILSFSLGAFIWSRMEA